MWVFLVFLFYWFHRFNKATASGSSKIKPLLPLMSIFLHWSFWTYDKPFSMEVSTFFRRAHQNFPRLLKKFAILLAKQHECFEGIFVSALSRHNRETTMYKIMGNRLQVRTAISRFDAQPTSRATTRYTFEHKHHHTCAYVHICAMRNLSIYICLYGQRYMALWTQMYHASYIYL